jgi:hypothetical protein
MPAASAMTAQTAHTAYTVTSMSLSVMLMILVNLGKGPDNCPFGHECGCIELHLLLWLDTDRLNPIEVLHQNPSKMAAIAPSQMAIVIPPRMKMIISNLSCRISSIYVP